MRYLKYTLGLLFIATTLSSYSQPPIPPKIFLGKWKTARTDSRTYSETEEHWVFKDLKTGTWTRKMTLSDGSIICDLKNPFTWSVVNGDKLKMDYGKTECQCKATSKSFEKGLADFVKDLKANYNNESDLYEIRSADAKSMKLDDFELKKE